MATLAEYVLAPKLDIQHEIGTVYSSEFALVLMRWNVLVHVYSICNPTKGISLLKLILWLFMFRL